MSCTLSDGRKVLEVCVDTNVASYRFGKAGQPAELSLTAPVGTFEYTPWPGIGRNIYEEIIFENNGVHYVVQASHERMFPEHDDGEVTVISHGSVTVLQGQQQIAHLQCDAGSVDFSY